MLFPKESLSLIIVIYYACILYAVWVISKTLIVAFDRDLRNVPGPFVSRFSGLPLKLAVLSGKRSVYIHALHKQYGSFVRIAPGEVAIADIDAWRKIHRIGSEYGKGPWYQGQTPSQYSDETAGVFGILNNKTASQRRRLIQSAGTKKIVAEWEPRVVGLARLTVDSIKKELETHGKSDVMKWWTFMTSDVLGSLAFGVSFDNVRKGQKSQLVHDIEDVMPYIGIRMTLPWIGKLLDTIPPALLGRFAPPWDRGTQYGRMAVANTRAAMKGGNQTLFSKMVLEDQQSQIVPDLVIEQEAANIIVAGTDTTAMSLTYLTYAVLKNESVKRKLVKEVTSHSAQINWPELEEMSYLNNVIQETLRLHPPVPGSLTRRIPRGGEDLGKHILPAGTLVSTQALTFHHDPTVFRDPLQFNPDRWNEPSAAMKEYFMPFGGPARMCLGQNIAQLEMLHAVFKLFRECADIKLAPTVTDESMEMVDFFTIKPKAGMCEIVPA